MARLGIDEKGTLTIALPGAEPATLFARSGLIVPFVLALAILGLGILRRRLAASGCPVR
jgi:apolipoprotein N-acyltransferase